MKSSQSNNMAESTGSKRKRSSLDHDHQTFEDASAMYSAPVGQQSPENGDKKRRQSDYRHRTKHDHPGRESGQHSSRSVKDHRHGGRAKARPTPSKIAQYQANYRSTVPPDSPVNAESVPESGSVATSDSSASRFEPRRNNISDNDAFLEHEEQGYLQRSPYSSPDSTRSSEVLGESERLDDAGNYTKGPAKIVTVTEGANEYSAILISTELKRYRDDWRYCMLEEPRISAKIDEIDEQLQALQTRKQILHRGVRRIERRQSRSNQRNRRPQQDQSPEIAQELGVINQEEDALHERKETLQQRHQLATELLSNSEHRLTQIFDMVLADAEDQMDDAAPRRPRLDPIAVLYDKPRRRRTQAEAEEIRRLKEEIRFAKLDIQRIDEQFDAHRASYYTQLRDFAATRLNFGDNQITPEFSGHYLRLGGDIVRQKDVPEQRIRRAKERLKALRPSPEEWEKQSSDFTDPGGSDMSRSLMHAENNARCKKGLNHPTMNHVRMWINSIPDVDQFDDILNALEQLELDDDTMHFENLKRDEAELHDESIGV